MVLLVILGLILNILNKVSEIHDFYKRAMDTSYIIHRNVDKIKRILGFFSPNSIKLSKASSKSKKYSNISKSDKLRVEIDIKILN